MPKKPKPDPVDIAIGHRIRAQRIACKKSQSEVGSALGVTFQQIQKYENGKNRVSGSRLTRLAEFLDTTPNTLLGLNGATPNSADLFDVLSDPAVNRMVRRMKNATKHQRRILAEIAESAMNAARIK